jgi:hypothetical protein
MASGKKTGSGRPTDFGPTYAPGDRIPTPDAVERNSDSAWALWNDVSAAQDAKFAETAPASMPMNLGDTDPRYAETAPASLSTDGKAAAKGPAGRAATVDEVMVEARKNNRVCPKPDRWRQLFAILPDKLANKPMAPPIGASWPSTPSLSKRMCMREHIEWAAAHGVIDEVFAFLKQLPEGDWHHMGD